jgi:hypothetical protein
MVHLLFSWRARRISNVRNLELDDMAGIYSDSEIVELMNERKELDHDWHNQVHPRPKRGHD